MKHLFENHDAIHVPIEPKKAKRMGACVIFCALLHLIYNSRMLNVSATDLCCFESCSYGVSLRTVYAYKYSTTVMDHRRLDTYDGMILIWINARPEISSDLTVIT